ncbi:MAG: hypothetical protein LH491_02610 [Pseudoxanthomonas sp.]|nr:hypothetical protein [Pseudoxanthomonas sp.]
MTQAADIIAALLAVRPAPVMERQTGLPYGWGLWLRSLKERLGTVGREQADAMVALLAQRPLPAARPRAAALNRWQAFRALFYHGFEPPLREERGLRWFAGATSFLMHLMFLLLLVLLALVRVPPLPAPEQSSRVQVEFIGEGTPEDQGGGLPDDAAAVAQPAPSNASAAPSPAAAPAAAASATTEQPVEPAPEVAQQNTQVTVTETPTTDFVLPPVIARTPQTTPSEIVPPEITPREVSVPEREITRVEVQILQRELPPREVAVPEVLVAVPEVRMREIPTPLPQVRPMQLPAPALALPNLSAPIPGVRELEIALPERGAASASSSATTASGAASATPAASTPRGTQPDATASGSASANRAGAAPSTQRGDDWGASTRNTAGRAGASAGLFNADGSVRIPDQGTNGASNPGAPGSAQQQRADADRASKWLERPQFPYAPTMFDKFWVPNESLLAEWVRRAIREVEVPIPGTSKKITCIISVLQAGGACSLSDPNLNDQPSSGKPPPDIPVKRQPIPTDS